MIRVKNIEKLNNNLRVLLLACLASIVGMLLAFHTANVDAAPKKKKPTPTLSSLKIPPPGSSFDQRVAFYKKAYKPKLDEDDKQHLENTCVNAQSTIRKITAQDKIKLDNYNETYKKIDGIIIVNIGKLQLANQSVFDLSNQEETFASYASEFKSIGDDYQQALSDSVVINCQSDPDGFQALLDADRAYYKAISDQSQKIYNFATNKVMETLGGYFD